MIKRFIAWLKGLFRKKDKAPAPLPVVKGVTQLTNRLVTCFKCKRGYNITLRKIVAEQGKEQKKTYICEKCLGSYRR